jgi:hypothetical protein
MVAMVLLALSPRLQPGEHHLHYSHGGRESIHSEEFSPFGRSCTGAGPGWTGRRLGHLQDVRRDGLLLRLRYPSKS